MIRPAQRKLLESARAAVIPKLGTFAEVLRRYGGADRVEDLTARGFDRLLDHIIVSTRFRSRQRPILSAFTRKFIGQEANLLGLTPFTFAADLRDLTGRGLINLLSRWERRGLYINGFIDTRREIKPAQMRLLQVARKRVGLEDARWYAILQDYGGVISAADLDRRGFDLCMAFLEAEGFDREPIAPISPAFGRRAGFASPEQVELIRTLWRAWTGPSAESEAAVEAGLNAWLERYHGASSLRFLTAAGAGKAITALRAMKARRGEREAHHG